MGKDLVVDRALALAKTEKLGLIVNGKNIEPGQYIPRAEAQQAPQIQFKAGGGPYLVAALDLDAPFQTVAILGPILHWIQPLHKVESAGGNAYALSPGDAPFLVDYVGPAPPPLSGPHRYLFFLYDLPADFDTIVNKYKPADGKPYGLTKRIRYDFDAFEREAKLGPILAANYFTSN